MMEVLSGKVYNNMDHMIKVFSTTPSFTTPALWRDNLPRIKDRAYVINLDGKWSY